MWSSRTRVLRELPGARTAFAALAIEIKPTTDTARVALIYAAEGELNLAAVQNRRRG